jgi:ribulose-phosphate 3-epimerase
VSSQMPDNIKIAPSILSADFGKLGEQVAEATAAGADYIHIDVMDGHFVPAISFGPVVVQAVRKYTNLPLDVHLMVEEPEKHFASFAQAKADMITVHIEACPHIHRTIQLIKELKIKAGVSINPGTPLCTVEEVLPYLDLVLVMTVNPGAAGQSFIPGMMDKIISLRRELDRRKLTCELEVDGGINPDTAPSVVKAGANVLVAGAAVFNSKESMKDAISRLKASFTTTV